MSRVGSLRGVQANPEPCNSNSNSNSNYCYNSDSCSDSQHYSPTFAAPLVAQGSAPDSSAALMAFWVLMAAAGATASVSGQTWPSTLSPQHPSCPSHGMYKHKGYVAACMQGTCATLPVIYTHDMFCCQSGHVSNT
jgi:hypothetical protein